MNITLRPWSKNDLDILIEYANNPHIAQNLRDGFPHPYTRQDGKTFISSVCTENPTKVFAITIDNNHPIGSIGVFPQTDIHRKNAEIGYWLAEPFWGKGIMADAVRQMVDYGFRTFDINRIFASPFGNNKASQRVLEKSGFTLEARLEKTLYKDGKFLDEYIYGIRRNEGKVTKIRPVVEKINIVIDCRNAGTMAEFYSKLLNWDWTHPRGNGWAAITSPVTGMVIAFQEVEHYRAPVWPWKPEKQGQMLHLDFYVDDLEKAVAFALECGAVPATEQYFTTSRTLFDPEGHPFCLDTDEPE